jgi:hypothetical protein
LSVSGSTDVVSFTEVYNTKTADATDRTYDKMALFGDESVLTETKTGKTIEVNLVSGQVSKFDFGVENKIIDIELVNKNIFIYDGRNISDINKNLVANVGNEVFSKVYSWNSTWYLLGQDGKIKKLISGKVTDWTVDGAELIDKPVSMTIDGTVWVISQTGQVINYEKGNIKKWNPSIKITENKIIGITTTAESSKVAVVSDKKIFVFEKSGGKLVASHNFEKIGIVESKMGNNDQIYVLGQDQKIYKVK